MATTEKKINAKAQKVIDFLKRPENVGKAFTLAEINEALGLEGEDAIKTGSLNSQVGEGKAIQHGAKVGVKVWVTRQVCTYGVADAEGKVVRDDADTDTDTEVAE